MLLPGTDLSVSPICLGTDIAGTSKNEKEFFDVLDRFAFGGGNFIDTANVYARWLPHGENCSEQMIGRWLKSRKNNFVVATKGGHPALDTWESRLNKTDLAWDIESSLSALGTETIDLYYLHRDDVSKPIGEILEMMNDFVREGKIRYFAASNFGTDRMKEAADYASAHGLAGFRALSNRCGLAKQKLAENPNKKDTMWTCDEAEWQYHSESKLPLIPYSATSRGYFAKRSAGKEFPDASFDCPENDAMLRRLTDLSRETGESVQTLAMTELVRKADFPLIPIVGIGRTEQINDISAAIRLLEE